MSKFNLSTQLRKTVQFYTHYNTTSHYEPALQCFLILPCYFVDKKNIFLNKVKIAQMISAIPSMILLFAFEALTAAVHKLPFVLHLSVCVCVCVCVCVWTSALHSYDLRAAVFPKHTVHNYNTRPAILVSLVFFTSLGTSTRAISAQLGCHHNLPNILQYAIHQWSFDAIQVTLTIQAYSRMQRVAFYQRPVSWSAILNDVANCGD